MKIMILDGNSIVNRAFYGIRMLNAPDGTPTNGIYGFIAILQKLLDEERPDALHVAFDLAAPTFRHVQFDGYKATRKPMPEELAVQIPILKEVLDAMGVRRCELEGYEADDLIGAISRRGEALGNTCVIVTGDKDSFQLITDKTTVKHIKTRMGQTETKNYTPRVFFDEYGFQPPKMVDLKALMGDSSDNIPGVAGIGEKTAMDLITRFGSLEGVYESIDSPEIKDGVRRKLAAGYESAKQSYELATICTDVPIGLSIGDGGVLSIDNDRLYTIFKSLGFSKFLNSWGLTAPRQDLDSGQTFQAECVSIVLQTREELNQAAVYLSEGTAGVYCDSSLDNVVFEFDCQAWLLSRDAYKDDYPSALKALFAPEIKKAGHNVKDIIRRLLELGISSGGWAFDTAIAAYLLDPTSSNYELERIVPKYCGFTLITESENAQMSLLQDDGTPAMFQKAASILCLADALAPKLEELGMSRLYYEIELPLCAVLAHMEHVGFAVDRQALYDFGESLNSGIDSLQQSIWELAGSQFNINSPKQLGAVLFDDLMLPSGKKTKTGWSTNADVLEKLRGKHPIIQQILDYRQLTKLKSTYADGLLKVIGSDGRIRTSFQMTVTATGRLSSTEPNLQNIPVRRELGGEIRKMFTAAPGNVLVDADYSQIELRLLAHISDDETMKNAFLSGEDIHAVTASQVFGVPLGEVTALQRSRAKAVNFGIVYGISAFSLAQDIGVFQSEAKAYMDAYLEKYHGVRDYMEKIVARAKRDGYVSTLYGRRRWLPELKSSNFNQRSFGERVALNMPIQGTAADIIKLAMVNVWKRLESEGLEAKLILQVHDELIVECPESEADAVKTILTEEMQSAAELSVPLTAEAHSGKTWYDAK